MRRPRVGRNAADYAPTLNKIHIGFSLLSLFRGLMWLCKNTRIVVCKLTYVVICTDVREFMCTSTCTM